MAKTYKTYFFRKQDPVVKRVLGALEGEKAGTIGQKTGVSPTTITNWRKERVMRPQFATIAASLGAVGVDVLTLIDNELGKNRPSAMALTRVKPQMRRKKRTPKKTVDEAQVVA